MVEEPTNGERTTEDAAGGGTTLEFLKSSLFVVMAGILVVGLLVAVALISIRNAGDANVDAMVSALTAGTGVIGTLVGAFLGLKLGTEDKDRVQQQADRSRQQSEQLLRAVAVLPPEDAKSVLDQVDEPTGSGASP
jgi:hypothetical protein